MEEAVSYPGWCRGHALTGCAGIRNAPEPVYRAPEDRPPGGVFGGCDERLAGRTLVGRMAAHQDARDPLCCVGASPLNSPTVSRRYQQPMSALNPQKIVRCLVETPACPKATPDRTAARRR